jgi:hypothetical protein
MRCYKRALALDPSLAVPGAAGQGSPSWVNNLVGLAGAQPPATPDIAVKS